MNYHKYDMHERCEKNKAIMKWHIDGLQNP